jgi:HEAT repeat protein
MSKGHKRRWIAAGLLVLVTGTGALVLRDRRAGQAIRLRGADGSTQRGLEAEPGGTPPAWPRQESEAQIAQEVDTSLAAWRQAILDKNADVVQSLDRVFLSSPERYRSALEKSARSDADGRVRAFSTRVLGKQKSAALAPLFETLLADKSPFVRQNAAWALGELAVLDDGRVAARHAVAELRLARAKDPAPDVRTAAKGALARLE